MLFNAIQRKILKTSLSEKCRERLIKGLQSVNRKTLHKEIDKRKFFEKLCMKFLDLAQNFLNEMDLADFTEALQLIGKLLLEISPLQTSYHSVIIKTRIASLKLHSLHIVPNIINKTKLVKISLQRAQCFAEQLNSCTYLSQIKKDYYSSLEILYMDLMIFNVLFLNYEISMKYLQKAKQTLKIQILELNQFMYLEDRKVFQLIKEKTCRMEQVYCLDYYLKKKMNVTVKKEQLKASYSFFDHILSTFDPEKNVQTIEEQIFKNRKSLFSNNLKTNCFDEQLQQQGCMSKQDQQSAGDVSFVLSVSNEKYFKIMQQIIPLRDLRDIDRKKTQTSYVSSQFVPTQKQLNYHSLDKKLQKRNQRNYSLNVFRASLVKQLIDFSNKQQQPKQQQRSLKIQELQLANKRRVSMFSKIRDQQIKYYQNVNPFTLQSKQKVSKTQITSSDSSQKKSHGMIFCPALVSSSKKQLKLSQSKKKNQKVRISLAVPPSSSIVRLVNLPNKTYCFNPIMEQENYTTISNQQKQQKFKKGVSKMLIQSWKYRYQMIQLKRIQLCNGWPYWYKIQRQYIKSWVFGFRQYMYIKKDIKFPLEILKRKINQRFQRRYRFKNQKIINDIQNLEETKQQPHNCSEQYTLTNIETNLKKLKKTSIMDVILLWIHMLCHKKVKNYFLILKIDNRIHICQYTIKPDKIVHFFITTNNTKKIKYIFKAKFTLTLSETIEKSLKQLFDKSVSPIQRWLSVTDIVEQHTTFRVFFMEKYTEKVYKYDRKFYRVACIQYIDKKLILMYEYKDTCTYLYFLQPEEDFDLKYLQKKKSFMQKFDNYKLIRKQNTIYLQISTNMNQYIINLKTSEKQIKPLQKLHKKNTL